MTTIRFTRQVTSTLYRADEAIALARAIQLALMQESATCHCLWRPVD